MNQVRESLESELRALISENFHTKRTDLCEVIKSRGSDKCSDWHNYTPIYTHILSKFQKDISLFELGLYHGCSIKAWTDHFPDGKIFGADINSDYLVNERNITSYICDQRDPQSIERLWKNFHNEEMFDLMIDDGEHEFESNYVFLMNSYKMLKKGGVFVVEDLTQNSFFRFSEMATVIKNSLGLTEAFVLDIPNSNNLIDNRMFVVLR